jgi:hypothetical protein
VCAIPLDEFTVAQADKLSAIEATPAAPESFRHEPGCAWPEGPCACPPAVVPWRGDAAAALHRVLEVVAALDAAAAAQDPPATQRSAEELARLHGHRHGLATAAHLLRAAVQGAG